MTDTEAVDGKAWPIDESIGKPTSAYPSPIYRAFVLGVLTLVYSFNFIDRQLLAVLQEPIKKDLLLSDTQLGMLSGFAFAVFYVTCGIPIAHWADRGTRRTIVVLALTVWSAMTAACGISRTYWQLVLARIGVGVGEAGCSPPIHSMISDIFPPSQRATALSVYSIGVHLGILIAFVLGAWLSQLFGWRVAFIAMGPPGLLLALLVFLTVREPGRSAAVITTTNAPSFAQVLALLWSRPSFRHVACVAGLQGIVAYSIGNWLASYFLRAFALPMGVLGTWLALAMGLGGGLGTLVGGYVTDRLGTRDKRWYLWFPASGMLAAIPIILVMLTTDGVYLALALNFLFNGLTNFYLGPIFAVTHGLVGPRARALGSAIVLFFINLIGLGLGPTVVGYLSDRLAASGNPRPLGQAMVAVGMLAAAWCIIHYLLAARTLRADLARAPA